MFKNVLRQVKPVIYRLKKEYGLEAYIYHPTVTDQNIETGKIIREYQIIYISQVVLLPVNWTRNFNYDLSYIASGKNFVYGGFYDVGKRDMMVDSDDLPKDFAITNNDFVMFEGKRYEIANAELSEHGQSWLMTVKQVASYDPIPFVYQVIEDVAGEVNYRINNGYFLNGVYNDQPSYNIYNGKYWLWFDDLSVSWVISEIKGTLGTFYWEKGDETITGGYTPMGTATGTVTVSTI